MRHLYKAILSVSLLICCTMAVLAQRHHPHKPHKPHYPNHPHHPNHPNHPNHPHPPHHPPSTCPSYDIFLNDPVNGTEGMKYFGFSISVSRAPGDDTLYAYISTSGTATAGIDYKPWTTAIKMWGDYLVWPAEWSPENDFLAEDTEYVNIRLDSVVSKCGGRITIGNNTVTASIADDDWDPADYTVVLSGATNGVEGGTEASIIMSMEGDKLAPEDIISFFDYRSGSTADDEDYIFTGSVIIPMGQHSGSNIISIVDDSIPEPTETARFKLVLVYGMNDRTSYPVAPGDTVSFFIVDNDSLQTARLATTNTGTEKPLIDLFPNPVASDLYVRVEKPLAGAVLVISNAEGQVMIRKNISSSRESISMTALPPGIYFVTINNGKEIIKRKIIKQ